MIKYKTNKKITPEQMRNVIINGKLERRVDDDSRLQMMIDNAGFLCTAWDGEELIGIARGLTDQADSAYLADLCVDADYQKQGIGRQLLARVEEVVGNDIHLALLSAEEAVDFYPKVGFNFWSSSYMMWPVSER